MAKGNQRRRIAYRPSLLGAPEEQDRQETEIYAHRTFEMIGQRMNCSTAMAKKIHRRAIKKLREQLLREFHVA